MAKGEVHVVPSDQGWRVEIAADERARSVRRTQVEARAAARELARQNKRELFVHGRDEQIRERNTYGKGSTQDKGIAPAPPDRHRKEPQRSWRSHPGRLRQPRRRVWVCRSWEYRRVMRIVRTFVWRGDRADDHDEIISGKIAPRVLHEGAWFQLRGWDVRYRSGAPRVTEAIYDEAKH